MFEVVVEARSLLVGHPGFLHDHHVNLTPFGRLKQIPTPELEGSYVKLPEQKGLQVSALLAPGPCLLLRARTGLDVFLGKVTLPGSRPRIANGRSRSLSGSGPFEDATPTAGGFHSKGGNRGSSIELPWHRGSTGRKAVVLPPLSSFFGSRKPHGLRPVVGANRSFLHHFGSFFRVLTDLFFRQTTGLGESFSVGGLEAQPPV